MTTIVPNDYPTSRRDPNGDIRKEQNHQRRITLSHKFFQPLTKACSITKTATMTYMHTELFGYRGTYPIRPI